MYITVLCRIVMTGEKKDLLIIGKSKKRVCFIGVKTLPVQYRSNSTAWMTSVVWNEYLIEKDGLLNQKMLLLVYCTKIKKMYCAHECACKYNFAHSTLQPRNN